MKVTLLTGKEFDIAPLTLAQVRRMSEAVDAGKTMAATVDACIDSIRNADPTGAPVSPVWFEEQYTIPEANELYNKIMDVSGLKMGETKANE